MADIDVGTLTAYMRMRDELTPVMERMAQTVEHLSNTIQEQMKKAEEGTTNAQETMKHGFEEGLGIGAGLYVFDKFKEAAAELPAYIKEIAVQSVESAHSIEMNAAKMQISTEAAQQYAFTLGTIGEPLEAMTAGFRKFEMALGQGSAKTVKVISDLGLSFQNLRNESPDKAMNEVLEALSKIENPAKRAAEASVLLGRGYQTLLPLLDSFVEKQKQAKELGTIINPDDLKASAEMGERVRTLGMTWDGLVHNFVDAALNSKLLFTVIDALTHAIAEGSKWVKAHREQIRSWVSDGMVLALHGVEDLIEGIQGLGSIIKQAVDWFITLKYSTIEVAIGIIGVADVTEKIKNLDFSGAKKSWETMQGAIGKTMLEADAAHKIVNETFTKFSDGTQVAMKAVTDLEASVKKLGTAQQVTGADTAKATTINNDEVQGIKAQQAAIDKLAASIKSAWNSEAMIGMTAFEKQQASINDKWDQLGTKLDDERSKLENANGEFIALNATMAAQFDIQKNLIAAHREAALAASETVNTFKMVENGFKALDDATLKYQEALQSISPTLQGQLDIMELKHQKELQAIDDAIRKGVYSEQFGKQIKEEIDKLAALNAEQAKLHALIADIDTVAKALTSLGGIGANIGGALKGVGDLTGSLSKAGGLSGMFGDVKDAFGGDGSGSILGFAKSFVGNFASVLPIASAAFGVVKMLGGLFGGKPEWEKVADELGKTLGPGITDATAKSIADTEAKFKGMSRSLAEALNIGSVIKDVGINNTTIGPLSDMIGNLFSGIASKSVPAKEGIAALGSAFSDLQTAAAGGDAASQTAMTAMIHQAKELGIAIPQLDAYIKTTMDDATKQLQIMLSSQGAGAGGDAQGAANAQLFGTMFNGIIAKSGLVEALKLEGPAIEAMLASHPGTALTGEAANAAMLLPLMKDSGFKAAAEGLQATGAMTKDLLNTDNMSQASLASLETTSKTFYGQAFDTASKTLSAADATKAAEQAALPALIAMQQAQALGLKLSPDMQAMMSKAQADGLLPAVNVHLQQLDIQKQIRDGIYKMAGMLVPSGSPSPTDPTNPTPTTPTLPTGAPSGIHIPTPEEIDQMRNSHIHAASGFEGWISRPTPFLIGEANRPEYVSVTPGDRMSDSGHGYGNHSSNNGGGDTYISIDGIVFGRIVTDMIRTGRIQVSRLAVVS